MNRQDKIKEGLISQLDDRNNYWPLLKPMEESTSQKVQQLEKSLSQEGDIHSMTEKWLSLTPNPPRNSSFLHTYKDSQPDSSRPTEHISSFVDSLTHSAYSTNARLVSQRYNRLYILCGKDKSTCQHYPCLNGCH